MKTKLDTDSKIGAIILTGIFIVILWIRFPHVALANKIAGVICFILTGISLHFALQYNAPNAPKWNTGGDTKGFIYFFLFFATILAGLAFLKVF